MWVSCNELSVISQGPEGPAGQRGTKGEQVQHIYS